MPLRRREILAAGVVAVLAGCIDGDESSGPTADATETSLQSEADSLTDTTDLDLTEANVTGVELEPTDGRTFEVAVTLIHDDDGEDGYANWWQVETLDGERLGRRDLAHAHGTREFTRSTDVDVPEDVSCLVVRGHDQTHDYGGQTMLVDIDSGAKTARRQGPDRVEFSKSDCP